MSAQGLTYQQARQGLLSHGVDSDTADLFLAWLRQHPKVWKEFEEKALNLIRAGLSRYGAKALFEVIRYENTVQKCCEFKVNNNYASYLARLFAVKYPAHKDFFEYRRTEGLKAA